MQNCYAGAKPKGDQAADQTERLTTKHIHTLKFLQEIVAENKELKQRIEELEGKDSSNGEDRANSETQNRMQEVQQEYLQKADEINMLLTEKHQAEMMQKVNEQLELERKWADEKLKLLAEIEQLKKEIEKLHGQLADNTEHHEQIQIFELKVEALEQEIGRLTESLSQANDKNKSQEQQLKKLDFLEQQNAHFKDELAASNQKCQELEFKVRKLEKDLEEQRNSEQSDVMNALKTHLAKMHREKAIAEEKDKENMSQISELSEENNKLRRALNDSEIMRQDMRNQLDQLTHELILLKKQLSLDKDRQTFKDFVNVKRELVSVKEENDALRIKLKFGGSQSVTLPSLKPGEAKINSTGRPGSGRKSDHKRRESVQRRDSTQLSVVPHRQ